MGSYSGYFKGEKKKKHKQNFSKENKNTSSSEVLVLPEIIRKKKNEES